MSQVKKYISGYCKKAGEPQKQFNFRVPHKGRLAAISAHLAKDGSVILAAWFNTYSNGIKLHGLRLK